MNTPSHQPDSNTTALQRLYGSIPTRNHPARFQAQRDAFEEYATQRNVRILHDRERLSRLRNTP